jgi:hypothetical protein
MWRGERFDRCQLCKRPTSGATTRGGGNADCLVRRHSCQGRWGTSERRDACGPGGQLRGAGTRSCGQACRTGGPSVTSAELLLCRQLSIPAERPTDADRRYSTLTALSPLSIAPPPPPAARASDREPAVASRAGHDAPGGHVEDGRHAAVGHMTPGGGQTMSLMQAMAQHIRHPPLCRAPWRAPARARRARRARSLQGSLVQNAGVACVLHHCRSTAALRMPLGGASASRR